MLFPAAWAVTLAVTIPYGCWMLLQLNDRLMAGSLGGAAKGKGRWKLTDTNYDRFSDLVRAAEERGHLTLEKHKDTLQVASSKHAPSEPPRCVPVTYRHICDIGLPERSEGKAWLGMFFWRVLRSLP